MPFLDFLRVVIEKELFQTVGGGLIEFLQVSDYLLGGCRLLSTCVVCFLHNLILNNEP